MMRKIHLKRSADFSFCGLYRGRLNPRVFTDDFRKATCKNCIKSAHYWRNRDSVLSLMTEKGEQPCGTS